MVQVDFPYTLDDEPTEAWKVEQVLHWWLLRAKSESDAEYDNIVEGLSKQLDEGKAALWEAHEQVSEILHDVERSDKHKSKNNSENLENQNVYSNQKLQSSPKKNQLADKPNSKTTRATTGAAVTTSAEVVPETRKPDTVHVDVLSGPNEGSFYDLQPKNRVHAWVGRSQGKKFKQKGISLPKDLEVSTSHGRFEYSRGKFFYTDVASTNGTRIDGEECEPNQPYEISTGMTILVGQTALKVTLLALK